MDQFCKVRDCVICQLLGLQGIQPHWYGIV